jgi:AraC family transcriptional activator of pobA
MRQDTFIPAYTIKTKEMRPQGFDILNLSASGNHAYDSSHLHRHTFYELFFFYGGEGRHEIDFMEYRVEGSSVHFVSPGQIHKLVLKRGNGFVICFTEDLVQLRQRESIADKFPFYDNRNSPVLTLNKDLANELGFLIESAARELKLRQSDAELFRSYLSVILLRLRTEYITSATNRGLELMKSKKVSAFRNLIEEHFLDRWSIGEYASKLSLSPNYLNALCKKNEGRSAITLVHERLLLEARRLLFATDMHVKEISYTLNFEDISYFNRFFKNHSGLTPNVFREQFSKNR